MNCKRKRDTDSLGQNKLGTVGDSQCGEFGPTLGVRGDGHDIGPFHRKHLRGISVRAWRRATVACWPVALLESCQTISISVRSCVERDFRPIIQRFTVA